MGKNKKRWLLASAAAATGAACFAVVVWSPFSAKRENDGKPPGEKEKISIVISSLGISFPPGMNENNNPYLDYIEKNTNLDIGVFLPPIESYEEKLNIMMTSSKLPDMLHTGNEVWLASYVRQGKLKPLDEEINKYGSALKQKIPKEAWDQVTYNGHIYAIPSLNEVKGIELMYVRKDWLDRLGLKPPRTLDEYYEVIRAFATRDPDGNGKNDTTGLLVTENLGRAAPFFGAFGTQLNQWLERDGRLVYSNVLPETKEAVAFLHKLYEEKLIEPDFPLNRIQNLYYDKIVSGTVGLFSATWYDTRGPIAQNKSRDPRALWIPLEYPTGPGGAKGVYSTNPVRGYNVVPESSPNAASVVKMLNFIAGEGHRNLKLGFENEVWSLQNGKMVTDFEKHNLSLYRGMYSSLADVVDPDMEKRRLDSLGESFNLYDNQKRIEANLIPNKFDGLPTPSMATYMSKLTASMQETFIKMIVGVTPLDEFDAYVERWKRDGLDAITREVNEWYLRPASDRR
ncbi:extracellular solute-binding protein [Paenibacillus ginsengarvi]|uniref:Extracellular solute-binding protein n=1 Tax=Paenibacillus ginsengarvi TaxID=400777 RepID=A0A3B0C344_9BACL|nr:extracellular solute-binding protein [Paenibacillus ginsengarvi]RKN78207.1 extracellular solute-binding protein [Paenibacillus ginsengarvi]